MELRSEESLSVIARALAFLCLSSADLRDKGLVPQGRLLEALGLSRKEAAELLNTSEASLRELLNRDARKSKKGAADGIKKKTAKK
jgi:hypothetical protein